MEAFLRFTLSSIGVGILLAAAACGSPQQTDDSAGNATARADQPAATATTSADEAFAFTEADLDIYERGLKNEIELVRAAKDRAMNAATAQERAEAAQAAWETHTMPETARSLGVDAERYRRVRESVGQVLRTLDFQGKIEGPMELDMTRASQEMKDRMARDAFADLAPASAAALRARLDRLVPIWAQYVELTAVAG